MIAQFKQLMIGQHEAALETLVNCIEQCPDESWHQPVCNIKFSHVAFHTLFFADLYMGLDKEAFRVQPFHHQHREIFGNYEELQDVERASVYEKPFILEYAEFCFEKTKLAINAETEESLAEPAGFSWLKFSRAEVYPYNIRHIQHHAAQMSLVLRMKHETDVAWQFSGRR